MSCYEKWSLIVTIIGIAVGIGVLLVYYRQLKVMKASVDSSEKAAEAALISANAANTQIKMMKDKDRARLAIRPGGFSVYWCPMLQSSLEISHSGPSEAFSVDGVYGLVVTNSRDIPEWKVWPIERTAGQQLPSVIKPGSDPIVISCSIPFGNKDHDAVENGTGFLHFFGRLDYIDIYGEPRAAPFRYICWPQGGNVQIQWHERCWVRHGPESDNTPI